jgi:hypothetical protein
MRKLIEIDYIMSEYLKVRSLNNSLAFAFMGRQLSMTGEHDTFCVKIHAVKISSRK